MLLCFIHHLLYIFPIGAVWRPVKTILFLSPGLWTLRIFPEATRMASSVTVAIKHGLKHSSTVSSAMLPNVHHYSTCSHSSFNHPCCLIMAHMRASSQYVIAHASFHAGGSRAIPLTRAHSHQKPKGERQTKDSHACSIATKDPNLTYKKLPRASLPAQDILPRYSP